MIFLDHIWLIPLLPAFGAAMMFFFGRKAQKSTVNGVCVGVVVLAFVMSCGAVLEYTNWAEANHHQPYEKILYTWLGTDSGHLTYLTHDGQAPFQADAGLLLDPLSSIWLLFVTGVGMLIHIYSTGYMAHEGGYYRFFGYLNLFMFSMLTLILANNYVLMFVGWEGVGLCSYLLIGFYFQRKSASDAANKAFIVNRIGDAGFILGMFFIAWLCGSLRYVEVNRFAQAHVFSLTGEWYITAATLLLFVGACGKSAQLPLYIWLPDAMEGPTPVSALIHAATMVTAGVYMVARSNALFVLAPNSMKVVAVVGALTAIFAASIGLVQNDIKRVLAYSTVSQLGYMFLALGVGAFSAGVFHVFTHAFFKALLFLGAGSVIHAMSGEQDMRRMGALRDRIPKTYWTMLIATLAISGIPPFAGFFSKDEILWQTWTKEGNAYKILWGIGYITALMTAFYMFRLIYLTFYSKPRMSHEVEHHIHESPAAMTMPLIVLAVMSLFAGFLGWPHSLGGSDRFARFLDPVFARGEAKVLVEEGKAAQLAAGEKEQEHTSPGEYLLMLLSVGAAGVGYFMAGRSYGNAGRDYTEPIAVAAPAVYKTLLNKYYVDEGYDYVFTGRRKVGDLRLGVMGLGEASSWFDSHVVDGAVNAAGWITRLSATVSGWWDKWIIDGVGVNGPAILARMLSYPTRLLEWGLVQWYALVMTAGLVGFVFYYVYH
jgi:NADH-quinone oxidoreductase subunit L